MRLLPGAEKVCQGDDSMKASFLALMLVLSTSSLPERGPSQTIYAAGAFTLVGPQTGPSFSVAPRESAGYRGIEQMLQA